jgi:hypothetical protein
MTLEIPETFAAQIEREATRRGTDAPAFLLEAARVAIEATPDGKPEAASGFPDALSGDAAQKRREAAAAGFGMFAGHGATVDEFLAARHAEAQSEAQKDGL